MIHHRTFSVDELSVSDDGRTVEGLAVPYNREVDVIEPRGRGVVRFKESFLPGSFERAVTVPHRVTFVYGHSDSFTERMGHAAQFLDTDDGLFARFRLDPSRAEQARDAIATSHGALSIGFVSIDPRDGTERDGQHVRRRAVHLVHVAAVPKGAYPEAEVTAIRSLDDEVALLAAEDEEQRAADHAHTTALFAQIDELIAQQAQWETRISVPEH